MKERIKMIMDAGGYTPVTFAAHIEINPQTMIANLNRNEKVSASILMAILEKFEDIHADWLLFGKGPMYKTVTSYQLPVSSYQTDLGEATRHQNEHASVTQDNDPRQLPLFPAQEPVYAPSRPQTPEYRRETPDKPQEKAPETIKYQEVIVEKIVSKKVSKIIIYYADNTFDTFAPE
jgi:DNA-binding XRE family transcriptional regulator